MRLHKILRVIGWNRVFSSLFAVSLGLLSACEDPPNSSLNKRVSEEVRPDCVTNADGCWALKNIPCALPEEDCDNVSSTSLAYHAVGSRHYALGMQSVKEADLRQRSPAAPGHRYIMIDQFGYRPSDPKIAVLVDPQLGYNAGDSFSPASTYEVRRMADGAVVYSGAVTEFNDGNTQHSSGDRGFWFDFSGVDKPGSYYLYDPKNKTRSHIFDISEHVYRDVLRAATRMFFYNRSGAVKAPPFADPDWADAPAYVGPGQDGEARAVWDKGNPETARDLRGGWFDAGDTNKYVTSAQSPVHQLLAAYHEAPDVWTDDFNIPESQNGIPDLLDEIKWELDWVKRMQQPDGGVLIKVGILDHDDVSPPSKDQRLRYYAPACSSSTIAAASMFAHAAVVFSRITGLASEAAELQQRAIRAWNWYHAHPKRSDCDTQEIKAGDADWSQRDQASAAVVAAIYLFASTDQFTYGNYVRRNYRLLRPYNDIGWTRYSAHEGEALLFYTALANSDPKVRQIILKDKQSDAASATEIYDAALKRDLYRAHITDSSYHWGSNKVRANNGNSNLDMLTYRLAGSKAGDYQARALGILHYLHGVNPQGMVYLSNMGRYGAEVSVSEIYHVWFADGTPWDSARTSEYGPAPGFLVGGPYAAYSGPLSPPAEQPPQKSYRDWNGDWPDNSWEITEPAIYYQAAYIKLLSKFASRAANRSNE